MSAFDTPFNDPYLAVLYSIQSPAANGRSSFPGAAASPPSRTSLLSPADPAPPSSAGAAASPLVMSDLMSTVPPHVTRFLVLSAPVLSSARTGIEVLLWKNTTSRAWSWAVVGAWWLLCLGGTALLRLLLPPAVLFALLYPSLPTPRTLLPARLQQRRRSTSSSVVFSTSPIIRPSPRVITSPMSSAAHLPPASTQSVQVAIANFSAVTTLILQTWPPAWVYDLRDEVRQRAGRRRVARAFGGVWALWVVGGYLLGLRMVLALAGTATLLAPSPYLPPIQQAFASSFFLTRLWLFIKLLVLGPSPSADARLEKQSLLRWAWTRSAADADAQASAAAAREQRGRKASMKSLLGTIKRGLSRPPATSTVGASKITEKEPEKEEWDEEPVLFRFEVMENQRWWLGLDWTGTLAPGDPPVWCDTHLHATPAPLQYTLPPAHTTTIPHTPDDRFNEVRIASWRWAEDDWSVLRSVDHSNPEGPTFVPTKVAGVDGGASAVSPLPAYGGKDIATHASAAQSPGSRMSLGEQALSRGLERLKQATASATHSSPSVNATGPSASSSSIPTSASSASLSTSPTRASPMAPRAQVDNGERKTLFAMSLGANRTTMGDAVSDAHPAEDEKEVEDLDALTDEAGWSYGGNKWEGMSAKGGLGKFTRRRRWVRLAVLEEHVHLFPKSYVLPNPPSAPSPSRRSLDNASSVSASSSVDHHLSSGALAHAPAVVGLDGEDTASATLIGGSGASSAPTGAAHAFAPGKIEGAVTTARASEGGAEAPGSARGDSAQPVGGPSEALRLRLKKAVEKGR